MKHLSILLFLLGVLVSAQENKPNVSDIIICETIDHTGFISVSEENFFEESSESQEEIYFEENSVDDDVSFSTNPQLFTKNILNKICQSL